jgi:hypothetical protein
MDNNIVTCAENQIKSSAKKKKYCGGAEVQTKAADAHLLFQQQRFHVQFVKHFHPIGRRQQVLYTITTSLWCSKNISTLVAIHRSCIQLTIIFYGVASL